LADRAIARELNMNPMMFRNSGSTVFDEQT